MQCKHQRLVEAFPDHPPSSLGWMSVSMVGVPHFSSNWLSGGGCRGMEFESVRQWYEKFAQRKPSVGGRVIQD